MEGVHKWIRVFPMSYIRAERSIFAQIYEFCWQRTLGGRIRSRIRPFSSDFRHSHTSSQVATSTRPSRRCVPEAMQEKYHSEESEAGPSNLGAGSERDENGPVQFDHGTNTQDEPEGFQEEEELGLGDIEDGMDPEGFSGPSEKVVKPLTREALAAFQAAQERAGVVYISRIPPGMQPAKVRHLMSAYGEIGRVYLQQEGGCFLLPIYISGISIDLVLFQDAKRAYLRRKYTSTKKAHFTEGWVEFKDKKVARSVAEMLNAQPIGGKKGTRWRDDVWTMKYLPKFKWNMLTEQVGEGISLLSNNHSSLIFLTSSSTRSGHSRGQASNGTGAIQVGAERVSEERGACACVGETRGKEEGEGRRVCVQSYQYGACEEEACRDGGGGGRK